MKKIGMVAVALLATVCLLTACIGTLPDGTVYTVTFRDHDGAILATESVESGYAAQAPATPVREGYVFVGWDKSFDKVTSDLTITALYEAESTAPQLIVSSVTAKAGDTVKVTVAMKNNPGIASIILSLTFDNNILSLENVSYNGAMGGQTVSPQNMNSPVKLYWINGLANAEGDMTFATLTFQIASTAEAGNYPIRLTYAPDDIYDIFETDLPFEIVNGKVTVTK